MAGSSYGTIFKITTWGESHGIGVGVVVDGCPAGLSLCEHDVQCFLDRRKPGGNKFTSPRRENDQVEILSGVFEGLTTGTPISMLVKNENQHSKDYGHLATCYRPGHADYPFEEKYGIRDYRGGGRSSGRETIGRVAAGAVASKLLQQLGINITTYAKSIGPIVVPVEAYDFSVISGNALCMPSITHAEEASQYLETCMSHKDSSGGIIECFVQNMPIGIGETVFDKLDANLAKAVMSIGAVKGFEIGDGFQAATARGSENNDEFHIDNNGNIKKITNHAGGILGGMSDGANIVLRAAIKPTPSIASTQKTINTSGESIDINIHGRHDPIIVPRAVVVVESMVALTLIDLLFLNMSARVDSLIDFYK